MSRVNFNDIINVALLYRKFYAGSDTLPLNKIYRFKEEVCKNLRGFGNCDLSEIGVMDLENSDDKIFFIKLESNNSPQLILKENVDVDKALCSYVYRLPVGVVIATQGSNALNCIDLEKVDDEIKEINSFEVLKRKLHFNNKKSK